MMNGLRKYFSDIFRHRQKRHRRTRHNACYSMMNIQGETHEKDLFNRNVCINRSSHILQGRRRGRRFLLAYNNASTGNTDTGDKGVELISLSTVTALYPNNGANWNDYVSSSTGTAADTACNAATDTACVHGGEKRIITVTGKTSCAGLTASDARGAFDWTCDDTTGSVKFLSAGIKDTKNLSDLLDFSSASWKANAVTVYSGATAYGATPSTAWWTNPVVADNDGISAGQAVSGTIYIVNAASPAATYLIDRGKVGFVIKPGVTLQGTGTTNEMIIYFPSANFAWLEGAVNADGDYSAVYLEGVKFSTLRNIKADNANSGAAIGVAIFSSSNNSLSNISAANNGNSNVYLESSSNNRLVNVTASNNGGNGIRLNSSNGNILNNMSASNNAIGFVIDFSSNNKIAAVSATNNDMYGVSINMSPNNTLHNINASNNGQMGVYLWSTSNNSLMQVTASNNGSVGVNLGSSSNNTLTNLAVSNNSSYGISFNSSSDNYFSGLLKVGNNATLDCSVTGGTNPGLVNATCANNGISDAIFTNGITLASSFVGKLTNDDTTNISDTNGQAAYPADPKTFDWVSFDNLFRAWGIDGSAFPNLDHQKRFTTGSGRIWDWSLLSSDIVIHNVLSLPTGSSTLTHTWNGGGSTAFLRSVIEISGDGIGNDNGLCESGETCLYTPNIGSYQGHGNLISAGTITTGGTITNVTILKYETNGY